MECHEGRRWGGSAAGSSCLLPASCRRRKWAISCPEVWLQHPWFCSLFLLGQGLLKSGLSGSFSALPPCPSSASSEEVFRGQLGFSWRTPCCCWAVLLCDPTAEAGGKGIRRLFLPLWCTGWLLQDRLDAGCESRLGLGLLGAAGLWAECPEHLVCARCVGERLPPAVLAHL